MTKASDLARPFQRLFNWTAIVLLFIGGAILTARMNTPVVQQGLEVEQDSVIRALTSVTLADIRDSDDRAATLLSAWNEIQNNIVSGDSTAVALFVIIVGGLVVGGLVVMGVCTALFFFFCDKQLQQIQQEGEQAA